MKIPGKRIKRTRLIQADRYVVAMGGGVELAKMCIGMGQRIATIFKRL